MIIPTLTTEQMTEVDRLMIEEYNIQLIQMMENAGRHLAEQARRMLGGNVIDRSIVVLCGGGNNGGGGMVAARNLHNWGVHVYIKLAGDESRLKDVPAHQWGILQNMGIPRAGSANDLTIKPDLIIDAIIGYGLRGDPHGEPAKWIEWANDQDAPILALDTPSGLDTTTGVPGTPVINAAATLTLALPKVGLTTLQAKPYVGQLYLADISIPPQLYQRLGIQIGPLFSSNTIIAIDYVGATGGSPASINV
jgi:NAD(P)H-hydrate epimerase